MLNLLCPQVTNSFNVSYRNYHTRREFRRWEMNATHSDYQIFYAVVAQIPYLVGRDAFLAEQFIHKEAIDANGHNTNLNWPYLPGAAVRVFEDSTEFHRLDACQIFLDHVDGGGPNNFPGVANAHKYQQFVHHFDPNSLLQLVMPYVNGIVVHSPDCYIRANLPAWAC